MDKLYEYTSLTLVVMLLGSITLLGINVIYKEVFKPEPPVECRSGKLFEVTTRDNVIVYEPTYNDCEVIK